MRWWGPPRRPAYGSIGTTERMSRSLPTSRSAAGGSDRLLQERSGKLANSCPRGLFRRPPRLRRRVAGTHDPCHSAK